MKHRPAPLVLPLLLAAAAATPLRAADLPSFQVHRMRCGQDTVHVAGWEAVYAVALAGPGAPRIAEVRPHPPGKLPERYGEQGDLGAFYRGAWENGRAWNPLAAPPGSEHAWRIGLATAVSPGCKVRPLRAWLEKRTVAGELAAVQPPLTASHLIECVQEAEPEVVAGAFGLLREDGIVVPVGFFTGAAWTPLEREPRPRWYLPTDAGVVPLEGGEVVELDHPYVSWGQRTEASGSSTSRRIRGVVLSEPRSLLRMLPADGAGPDAAQVLAWLDTVHAEGEADAVEGPEAAGYIAWGFPARAEERREAPLRAEALTVSEAGIDFRLWGFQVERRYPRTDGEDPGCPLRSVLIGHARMDEGVPVLVDGRVTLTTCDGKELAWNAVHALLTHGGEVFAIGEARDWDGGDPAVWRSESKGLVRESIVSPR